MTDRDALIAAITAHPDDDTPRLVYADWLQENGEPDRAEFIRLQCRLEHRIATGSEWDALAVRESELRAKLFGHLDALGFTSVTFRRGFVGTITSGMEPIRDGLEPLRAALAKLPAEDAPAYELVIRDEEGEDIYDDGTTAEVFAQPALRRCVSLDLPCLGPWASVYVLKSEHLANVRRLNFPENEAGPKIELVASPIFANLRWANFCNSDSYANCPSIVPLAECPHLANLEHLDFGSCEQVDEGARAVAAAEQWTRLRFLNLSVGWFSAGAVAELFATPNLPALRELDLTDTLRASASGGRVENGDPFLPAIADSPLFARLSKLWLQDNGITDEGAKALAASPREVKLTLLDLTGNPITEVGERALRKRFGNDVCVFEAPER